MNRSSQESAKSPEEQLARAPLAMNRDQIPSIEVLRTTGESLSQSDLQVYISQLEERAEFEEREGCFGIAEICWKRAYALSKKRFPGEKRTARIARNCGLFLSHFLPESLQPVPFLKDAADIERCLDASSFDTAITLLALAQVLINSDNSPEAESILTKLLDEHSEAEVRLRATTYLSRIRFKEGKVLEAEAMLRTHIEEVRRILPNSEVLAEALHTFSELLDYREKSTDSQTVLKESLTISRRTFDDKYLRTLESLVWNFRKHQENDKINEIMTRELSESPIGSYRSAALLKIRGEASSEPNDILNLLRSYSYYRQIQPVSWYAAHVLMQILDYFSYIGGKQSASLKTEVDEQLSALLTLLPAVSSMKINQYFLMVGSNSCDIYVGKLFELAKNEPEDELVAGEALLSLAKIKEWAHIQAAVAEYTRRFPSSQITARLYSFSTAQLGESLNLHQSLHMSQSATAEVLKKLSSALVGDPPECMLKHNKDGLNRPKKWRAHPGVRSSELMRYLQTERELLRCPAMLPNQFTFYMHELGFCYEKIDEIAEAECCYKAALDASADIDQGGFKTASCLQSIGLFYAREGRDLEAEQHLKRCADLAMYSVKASFGRASVPSDLLLFYGYTQQRDKQESYLSECVGFLQRLSASELNSMDVRDLIENVCKITSSERQLKLMLILTISAMTSVHSSAELLAEIQRFCAYRNVQQIDDFNAFSIAWRPTTAILGRMAEVYVKQGRFEDAEVALVRHNEEVRFNSIRMIRSIYD